MGIKSPESTVPFTLLIRLNVDRGIPTWGAVENFRVMLEGFFILEVIVLAFKAGFPREVSVRPIRSSELIGLT